MNKSQIIDTFRDLVIQIATPYSTGTGFILKDEGIIITNEHVIRDNKKVVVKGSTFEKALANVIFADPKYDLAFLSIEQFPEINHSVKLTDNISLTEGDKVIAVGHPFGLKYTATAVSYTHLTLPTILRV